MNRRQLEKLGIPQPCLKTAVQAARDLAASGLRRHAIRQRMQQIAASPALFAGDPVLDSLARKLREHADKQPQEAVSFARWGSRIDDAALQQMQQACGLPGVTAAAIMPDAHVGYGLPIGGVLAMDNVVIPYAVGVDIACRMKLSVLDLPVDSLQNRLDGYRAALENGTRFGVGSVHSPPQDHPVLDADWTITRVTRQNRDKARRQLGTSGSGNHFVEFGTITLQQRLPEWNLEPGTYVALLSHSGSRGPGAAVCSTYSRIARQRLPRKWQHADRLAWLDLDSHEGQEYWAAMNLMGDFAAACHDVIHRLVTRLLGAQVIADVENHHNFAWKETHGGRDVIVHRKGATPAGSGVLGVIPGSMADPAFVVRGRGQPDSLCSAAHGAGRVMSRRKAKATWSFSAVRTELARRGIHVLSAGSDEVPGVYKDIIQVMAEQADLVEPVARFDPRIVKMCDDGSRPED